MTSCLFSRGLRGMIEAGRARRRAAWGFSAAVALIVSACDRALEVTDPDVIAIENINSPESAEGLRLGTLGRLNGMTSGGESVFHFPGLLTDEWRSGDTFVQRDATDQRFVREEVSVISGMWYDINRTRTAANQAIDALRAYPPAAASALPLVQSGIAQMYWARGFAETAIAENYCNGTPLSSFNLDGSVITYGAPESNAQVYARALASFDSASAGAASNTRGDTVRILARIGRARVLLNQGDFARAGAEIAASPAIPSDFRFRMFHQEAVSGTAVNQLWALNNSGRRYVVGDKDGTVGLNFASSGDPRIPVCRGNDTVCRGFGVLNSSSFDGNFGASPRIGGPYYVQLIWPTRDDDVAIVTGVEARLIEAEAKLRSGDAAGWLQTLNTLRASFQSLKDPTNVTTAGAVLAPLVAPGTQIAQEDLHFRERAFWLFGRGHRLADMRRLVRPVASGGFGRAVNTVYPNGPFFKGGTYGEDVNIIVPQSERNNPNFSGCTDRNP
ncbi:MAG TPA: hypothetical protein VES88_16230 [Gemmatimonadaceae bacterium]|nr:hypothetical protein [Gemmatimonadaceae bacterium]